MKFPAILFTSLWLLGALLPAQPQGISSASVFAPHRGLVKEVEKPLRDELCLNGRWQFMPVELPEDCSFREIRNPSIPAGKSWEKVPVKVPSPWNVNGFTNGTGGDFRSFPSYPEHWNGVKAGWLRKEVSVPADWSGNRIILNFEAVAGYARLLVNGRVVGDHFDSFLPFSFDVTDYLEAGEKAEITLWVAHGSLLNDPGDYGRRTYVAGSFWGIFIAGIWQDVYLQKLPPLHITDTYIRPRVDRDELEVEVTLTNTTSEPVRVNLEAEVKRWINHSGNTVHSAPGVNWTLGEKALSFSAPPSLVGPGDTSTVVLATKVNGALDPWAPGHPDLYGLLLDVEQGGATLDTDYTRFGWRQFRVHGTNLYLNGKPVKLRGDSWHFMGVPQMTRRYAWAWYRMLQDANANAVRLHAQVFPRFYLEMADEMGICVLDETAIWSSDGGPKIDSDRYWESCRRHVRGMILRDRNHPSVFGWSVCNETLPVTKHVFNAPPKLIRRNVKEINRWVAIARETDPTRSWISGDGETQAKTDLPTVIGHYGGERELLRWSEQGKPWGIGETGMAYYGTPAQVAEINGDRAYESQQGRMEGLAGEAFELITKQRELDASYASVFNLAWYGVKPLPLGLRHTGRAPSLEDGIFFPGYTEGKPGYQPERLGPYATTFNPGYDPTLPLYDPWPLFEAVRAAFSDEYEQIPNRWGQPVNNRVLTGRRDRSLEAVWLSSRPGGVKNRFEELGLPFHPLTPPAPQLILVDGSHPPEATPDRVAELEEALINGSTLLVWGAGAQSGELIEQLSGSRVTFFERPAHSYIVEDDHAILNGQSNASLYFSELTRNPVSTVSMGGAWVDESQVLLKACKTDWHAWNYQPETVKTARVIRSEREEKPVGNVLVRQPYGEGEILVSAVDFFRLGEQARPLVRTMIANLGGSFEGILSEIPEAIDQDGVLRKVNFYGSVKNDSREIESVFDYAPLTDKEFTRVHVGTLTQGKYWDILSAGEDGVFDFLRQPMQHSNYASVYLSFWMYSPRSLTDLLIEPGLPRVDMHAGVDDALAISINGTPVDSCMEEGGFREDEIIIRGVPLEKGWNHVLLKVGQGTGDWKCRVRFSSNKPGFMKEIKTTVDRREAQDDEGGAP